MLHQKPEVCESVSIYQTLQGSFSLAKQDDSADNSAMARLRDVSTVLKKIGPLALVRRVIQQVIEDEVTTLGAALAYGWLFAAFPFLVFLLSLVPLIPDQFKPDVQTNVIDFAKQTMPEDVASFTQRKVTEVLQKPSAGGFLSFGLVLALWAASGGMATTMAAMDKAYDVVKQRPFFMRRLLALLLTIIVASLAIVIMILLPVGTGVLKWLVHQQAIFPWLYVTVDVARYAIALLLMFIVLAIIYHFGPSIRQRFVPITPGAVFSVGVWLLLGWLFRVYLTKLGGASNYNRTYGTVAGAALLLLFFYIDALVLLIGAELNSEIDFVVYGVRGENLPAVPPEQDSVKPA